MSWLSSLFAEELEAVRTASLEAGATAAVVTKHHALGGAGAIDLAEAVVKACSGPKPDFQYLYDVNLSIKVCWLCILWLPVQCYMQNSIQPYDALLSQVQLL